MRRLFLALAAFGFVALQPVGAHIWEIASPDHEQTFTFGSERGRQWVDAQGRLAVIIHFTNDPYVNEDNPRRYDDFTFDFPDVTLGPDGKTFFYRPSGQRAAIRVAVKRPGLFGDEVRLLPSSFLVVDKPHGLLSLTLLVSPARPDFAQF
jgi:hypothetical protein